MRENGDAGALTRRIGAAAVKARTGRSWQEWFSLLDGAGAVRRDHKGIVAWLAKRAPEIGGWWQQGITVAYEQARGLRRPHEKPGGFEVGVSRTIAAPAAELFKAWTNDRMRGRWLHDPALIIHRATPSKSLRATWKGARSVSVNFYPKGTGKTQVALQHCKLPDAKAVQRMKKYWTTRLSALADVVA